jgi:hypothetical protein
MVTLTGDVPAVETNFTLTILMIISEERIGWRAGKVDAPQLYTLLYTTTPEVGKHVARW